MHPKIDVEKISGTYPLFIYRRLALPTDRVPFFFPIDPGFWYWLRFIRAKWPEIDAAGATFAPELTIEIVESAVHRVHQNATFNLRLITSPASNGVQINAGGQMTATGPRSQKMLNEIRPQRDNITFYISGQNATPFPAFIDLVVFGYMIPDSALMQWKGTNDE